MVSAATLGYTKPTTPKATKRPTVRELEWAAGFLDGEGCFSKSATTERIGAPQNDPQLLYRLQSLFGGAVGETGKTRPRSIWQWTIYGTRARGVMLTLYTLLSDKRKKEIMQALYGDTKNVG